MPYSIKLCLWCERELSITISEQYSRIGSTAGILGKVRTTGILLSASRVGAHGTEIGKFWWTNQSFDGVPTVMEYWQMFRMFLTGNEFRKLQLRPWESMGGKEGTPSTALCAALQAPSWWGQKILSHKNRRTIFSSFLVCTVSILKTNIVSFNHKHKFIFIQEMIMLISVRQLSRSQYNNTIWLQLPHGWLCTIMVLHESWLCTVLQIHRFWGENTPPHSHPICNNDTQYIHTMYAL
jgi:hypothetical protein